MCKIAGVTQVTDANRSDVWVFMQLLGELMSIGNKDGLGYAAFDKRGNLFGEKWLYNETAFKDLSQISGINAEKMAKLYSYFGDKVVKNDAQAIILHTRAATCGKGIENTHPFVNNEDSPEVAIIHNGMIYNDMAFKKKYSTCDSEVLAHLYADNKVAKGLEKLNNFVDKLQGWFTVLSLTKDNSGKMVLDAFSDSGRLGSYFIKELNARVYATYADDVYKIAKELGFTAIDYEKMDADTAFRIDVMTGEQIGHLKLVSAPVVSEYSLFGGWAPADNVAVMRGNLDDEEFRRRFWRGFN